MHPPEVGGLGGLVALVGLGHGVGDVLDEGEVGEDLSPGLAGHLAPGQLDLGVELGGPPAGQLDGQAEEGGHEGRLGWEGGVRLASGSDGVPGPEREPACWIHW